MESLQEQLEKLLDTYATQVRNDVNECCMETAKECGLKLRQTSPKHKGKYAKGWAVKEVATGGFEQSTWVVYNKTSYQLTHLLEKGHAKRNGGRVRAIPHIKPVETWAQQELPKELKDKLGG